MQNEEIVFGFFFVKSIVTDFFYQITYGIFVHIPC